MVITLILFWLSIFVIFWTYFGYFAMLWIVSNTLPRKRERADFEPEVSLVITAYNEEKRIREKLDNSLSVDYPREKLEIIVVSDASTDDTNQIVRSYADRGVQLMVMSERNGKHFAQGRGIKSAKHEIVVLTDATTFLDDDALRKIVSNFADPSIGTVSGRDKILTDNGEMPGEGAYVQYEMKLRELESQVGSLVGVSGCFFAIRKQLADHWLDHMSSDFYMPIVAYMNGYRSILDDEAFGAYKVLREPQKEFERKVRTVVHGLEVLSHFKSILNPFKYGFYAFEMISHKLFRWLVPFCMVIGFISNALLVGQGDFYDWTFAIQLVFYVLVSVAFLAEKLQDHALFRYPAFLLLVNASILVAWYKYITGEQYVVWDATKR
jgi:glycosyltransferase involved in cell wall biosynthesis